MKLISASILALTASLASLPAAAADTASWSAWTTTGVAQTIQGSFTQNGSTINVTFSGSGSLGVEKAANDFTPVASFTNAAVTNTPGALGLIMLQGGTAGLQTIHFSAPVTNPLMEVITLGDTFTPVSFQFTGNPVFSIGASGSSAWGGTAAGSLVQVGTTITGKEGSGLLQFQGTYTDITFYAPNYEWWQGFTVGAMATVATPVPEPETYALMLGGMLALVTLARRRQQRN